MSTHSLLDAIRVVKENERKAMESYADAARNIHHSMGKRLFEQLSEFETYHYERLSFLEKSLEETGQFIAYQGREFPLPPVFDIKAAKEPGKKSVMKIVSQAMNLEEQAEKAYAGVAAQVTDPQGREMFERLANEERQHLRILTKAYWSLNDSGVWNWSRP